MIRQASLPTKNMMGMWVAHTMMNRICKTIERKSFRSSLIFTITSELTFVPKISRAKIATIA